MDGMRFEIPQFINVPDKLFGPFTFKQTLYLVGGGGIVYAIHRTLPSIFMFILGIPVAALSIALVFYKPNGREFIDMLEAAFVYAMSEKFYLWRRREPKQRANVERKKARILAPGELPEENPRKKISDLAWSLDILDFNADTDD